MEDQPRDPFVPNQQVGSAADHSNRERPFSGQLKQPRQILPILGLGPDLGGATDMEGGMKTHRLIEPDRSLGSPPELLLNIRMESPDLFGKFRRS